MLSLEQIRLNKSSAVPLYEQLRQILLGMIKNGKLEAGTKLPTEEELGKLFDISRPVIRQAYSKLIEEGYVERLQGRGSFVKNFDLQSRFINQQLSFEEEMRLYNRSFSTNLLSQKWINYEEKIFSKLQIENVDERCLALKRLRCVDEHPYVLIENYLPESLFPQLEKCDFESHSLYATLKEKYGVQIVGSKRIIKAMVANQEFAKLFRVEVGVPVLYMENVSYDQYSRLVDYSREFVDGRSEQIEFDVKNNM